MSGAFSECDRLGVLLLLTMRRSPGGLFSCDNTDQWEPEGEAERETGVVYVLYIVCVACLQVVGWFVLVCDLFKGEPTETNNL